LRQQLGLCDRLADEGRAVREHDLDQADILRLVGKVESGPRQQFDGIAFTEVLHVGDLGIDIEQQHIARLETGFGGAGQEPPRPPAAPLDQNDPRTDLAPQVLHAECLTQER